MPIAKRAESEDAALDHAEFIGEAKGRFRFLEQEATHAREAREEFIPRIKTMERAVLGLTDVAIPKLTALVETVGAELTAQREERAAVRAVAAERIRIAKWIGGVISAAIATWLTTLFGG